MVYKNIAIAVCLVVTTAVTVAKLVENKLEKQRYDDPDKIEERESVRRAKAETENAKNETKKVKEELEKVKAQLEEANEPKASARVEQVVNDVRYILDSIKDSRLSIMGIAWMIEELLGMVFGQWFRQWFRHKNAAEV